MKKRTRISVVGAVALTLTVAGVVWQRDRILGAYWVHRVHEATDSLPHCDRAEIFLLDGKPDKNATTEFPIRPYNAYATILDQKTLSGAAAETLATHWRELVFAQDYSALCHYPGYGLRFYRGSFCMVGVR